MQFANLRDLIARSLRGHKIYKNWGGLRYPPTIRQSDHQIIQPQNDASAMAAAGQPAFAVCRQHPKLMSMVLEVLINVVMYE